MGLAYSLTLLCHVQPAAPHNGYGAVGRGSAQSLRERDGRPLALIPGGPSSGSFMGKPITLRRIPHIVTACSVLKAKHFCCSTRALRSISRAGRIRLPRPPSSSRAPCCCSAPSKPHARCRKRIAPTVSLQPELTAAFCRRPSSPPAFGDKKCWRLRGAIFSRKRASPQNASGGVSVDRPIRLARIFREKRQRYANNKKRAFVASWRMASPPLFSRLLPSLPLVRQLFGCRDRTIGKQQPFDRFLAWWR